jgi:hypothetical protein
MGTPLQTKVRRTPGFEFEGFEMAANDWAPGRDTPLGATMTAGHTK